MTATSKACGYVAQPVLDDVRQILDADVVAPARGARDHHGPAFAQPERLQDLPRDLDLLHGIRGERDAKRVSDPVREQRADPDCALDPTRELGAGLGHSEV